MKLITSLSLVLAGLAVFGTTAMAQTGPVPQISSVPQRPSYAPGTVVINGANLGLVTTVKINGVAFPIIHTKPARLIVGPVAPQDAGFGTVEASGGNNTTSATIQLLPTLKAERHGTRMTLTLNNGDVGTYTLHFAYSVLASPASDSGIYGKRWLSSASSTLPVGTGVFTDANPLTITGILIPVQFGQIGAPLRLQASCSATTAGVTAYTNLATMPAFGNPLP